MPQSFFGLFKRGLLFGRFLKNFSWSPLALFQKMRVLGNLAKFAITWPFGQSWIRLLRQNLVQSLHFKCILVRLLFGRFLKHFLWSPLCTFIEKRVLGYLAKIAITWLFGQLWSRYFLQNLLQSWRYKCI